MKQIDRKSLILFLFIIAFSLIALTMLINDRKPIEVYEFDVVFSVINESKVGLDVNGTALTFGKVTRGGGGERFVVIENNYDHVIRADVYVSDFLSKVIVTNQTFYIGSMKNVTVDVNLNIPEDFEFGEYRGKIRFNIYKE